MMIIITTNNFNNNNKNALKIHGFDNEAIFL